MPMPPIWFKRHRFPPRSFVMLSGSISAGAAVRRLCLSRRHRTRSMFKNNQAGRAYLAIGRRKPGRISRNSCRARSDQTDLFRLRV